MKWEKVYVSILVILLLSSIITVTYVCGKAIEREKWCEAIGATYIEKKCYTGVKEIVFEKHS